MTPKQEIAALRAENEELRRDLRRMRAELNGVRGDIEAVAADAATLQAALVATAVISPSDIAAVADAVPADAKVSR